MKTNFAFFFALAAPVFGAPLPNDPKEPGSPDQYNVVWTSPSKNSSESMPVGGGDVGVNVWVEDNQVLCYLQRSGIHDEFNGFPKLGRIRIWTEPNIFAGAKSFCQELKLRESCVEISTDHPDLGKAVIKVWVEVGRPVVHIEVDSEKDVTCYAQYESWRTEPRALDRESDLGERWSWWDIEGWPHEAILEADRFVQKEEGIAFYHVNPAEKLTSRLAYDIMGLGEHYGRYFDPLKDLVWGGWLGGEGLVFDGKQEGQYQSTPYAGWRYRTKKPVAKQRLNVLLHTSRCGTGEKWLEELEATRESEMLSPPEAWKKNQAWWKAFWERSHLVLNPGKSTEEDPVWRAGRNYNLFRYMTACNAYGENPTMFNGGLFSFDPGLVIGRFNFHPDWRRWGGGNYTLQNQRWVYWPMLKWGDAGHMENQFDQFTRVLDVAELRVSKNYGHAGSMFEEPATVYGLPSPLHYGFYESYLDKRTRYQWNDTGRAVNWAVGCHRTAALEFSYMVLEYHRYTGRDISKWLPFVKSTLDFFDQHYRMRGRVYARQEYDKDGKIVLFPSSTCESHFFVSNPVPDVAGLKAVVSSTIGLPEAWVDEFFGGKKELLRLQKTLPDFHLAEIDGDVVIPPARSVAYPNFRKTELYISYPMFPFNQIGLGDPEMEYVHNTYKHWETWQTPRAWTIVHSWANANVAFARMGMTERAADLTLQTLSSGKFRFPAFWGPGYDWVPDHNWGGTGAVGLQEMLMQTLDQRIVLFPSWPKDWDVDFRMHAPYQTILEGKVRDGKLTFLKVDPPERKNDVVISKPSQVAD